MDKPEWVRDEMAMMAVASSIPKDVRYMMCDMGYYNDVMKGYMIAGMRKMGFPESEIRKAVLGMRAAHDELTAEEAEKVYTGEK